MVLRLIVLRLKVLCVCRYLAVHDVLGWPEPFICTVYGRMFGDSPAKNAVYTPNIYMVLAIPTYYGCAGTW